MAVPPQHPIKRGWVRGCQPSFSCNDAVLNLYFSREGACHKGTLDRMILLFEGGGTIKTMVKLRMSFVDSEPETGCRWRCETRRPRFATQSSDAFILNARAHCLALQMIFFSSPPQGSDDFCKVLRKQLVTQLNCGNHASCKEPRNTTRCSFYRGGRNKN